MDMGNWVGPHLPHQNPLFPIDLIVAKKKNQILNLTQKFFLSIEKWGNGISKRKTIRTKVGTVMMVLKHMVAFGGSEVQK